MNRSSIARVHALWFIVVALFANWLPAQSLWSLDAQTGSQSRLWGVAYGNNALMAVGEHGCVIYSDYGGKGWQRLDPGVSSWLLGIAFANGRWVIVGDAGTILVSDDSGVSWSARPSGTTARLNNVAYGNSRWLAVGEQGVVVTSADGDRWTAAAAPKNGFLRGLTYGQGQFYVGGASGALYTTTDGVTFQTLAPTTTADIEAIAVGSSHIFIAGGRGLLASAPITQLNQWDVATGVDSRNTFRGLVARNDAATAIGDYEAYSYSDTWRKETAQPRWSCYQAALGLDEIVAVGDAVWRTNSIVTVSVYALPSSTVIYGQDVTFNTSASAGTNVLSVQWQRNNVDLPGQTNAPLVLRATDQGYASGNFTVRGTVTGGLLKSSAAYLQLIPAGRPDIFDPGFEWRPPTSIASIAIQADGKILVLEHSPSAANFAELQIIRLGVDGSVDPGFRPAVGADDGAPIHKASPSADGGIYITGNFLSVAGQPRPGLAKLRNDGALDATFAPKAPDGIKYDSLPVLAPDGRCFVSTANHRTLRLNPDGSIDPTFPEVAGAILGLDHTGRVYVLKDVEPYHRIARYSNLGIEDAAYAAEIQKTFPRDFGDGYSGGLGDFLVVDDDVFGSVEGLGAYSFFRLDAFGRMRSDYGRVAGGVSTWFRRPDGGLWLVPEGIRYDLKSYSPLGQPEWDHYATPPCPEPLTIRAMGPDGTMYVELNEPRGVRLVRLHPIIGRAGRLSNLSVRSYVASPAEPLIAGFVTSGFGTTRALVRAIGPALRPLGVTDALRDPVLTLTRDGTTVATNDNWDSNLGTRFANVGAFPLNPGSLDAALETEISTGSYTAVVSPSGSDGGVGLLELYESADAVAPRRFVNVSARAAVSPERPLIVGFSISGDVPSTVLIRGLGPALSSFGVPAVASDPLLTLFRQSTILWTNDNWSDAPLESSALSAAASAVGAFPLRVGGKDAGMLVTLSPGSYTAQLSVAAGDAGTAFIEIYEVR